MATQVLPQERKLEEAASVQHFLYRKNQVSATEATEIKNNILLHKIHYHTWTQGSPSPPAFNLSQHQGLFI